MAFTHSVIATYLAAIPTKFGSEAGGPHCLGANPNRIQSGALPLGPDVCAGASSHLLGWSKTSIKSKPVASLLIGLTVIPMKSAWASKNCGCYGETVLVRTSAVARKQCLQISVIARSFRLFLLTIFLSDGDSRGAQRLPLSDFFLTPIKSWTHISHQHRHPYLYSNPCLSSLHPVPSPSSTHTRSPAFPPAPTLFYPFPYRNRYSYPWSDYYCTPNLHSPSHAPSILIFLHLINASVSLDHSVSPSSSLFSLLLFSSSSSPSSSLSLTGCVFIGNRSPVYYGPL